MNEFNYRALVVDDEPIICRRVSRALAEEGIDCSSAYDGEAAWKMANETSYDLVVTDLKMPNKNGRELITEMQQLKPRPLIVVLTAVDEPEVIKSVIQLGADDINIKPVKMDAFAAKLQAMLEVRLDATRV